MPKLSAYVELAATEYLQETGQDELDARWIAAFFQDGGVLDDHPQHGLIEFAQLVQKALTKQSERARKQAHFHLDKVIRGSRGPQQR